MKKTSLLVALLVILIPGALVLADVAFQSTQVITHRFPGPIDAIVVRADRGDVALVAARGRGVTVRETRRYVLRQPTLDRDLHAGVLTLDAHCDARFVTCLSDLRVSVPAGAMVTVRSDAGDVEARRVDVAQARLRSDAGDIRLELLGRQRLVRARADSGDVDVVARDARAVDVQTDSGDVVVTAGAAPSVAARSDSGDVVVAVRARPRRVRVSTDSGDVRVLAPSGAYAVRAETDSGDVKVGREISRNDRAAHSIQARSDSGDVTLDGG
jgi:hypothetical protein